MVLLTCVSGYFPVKNKHNEKYNTWFTNTLSINCPYVFFTDKENIELIKSFRKDLPTHYVICDIKDFYAYPLKDKMRKHWKHCPSVELNVIWNEKVFMVQKASEINPFNSEWFFWIDAGMCVYRMMKPPNNYINEKLINSLPKDKFIYSRSDLLLPYDESQVSNTNYYHHVSGTFVMHKSFVNQFAEIYRMYIDKLIDKKNIWTEQVILTHIFKDNRNMFYKLCDGYGRIAPLFFK